MRSVPTLGMRLANSQFVRSNPAPLTQEDLRKTFTKRAYDLAQKADTLVEKSIYGLFGPEFLASIAFALDPLTPYLRFASSFAEPTRTRIRYKGNTTRRTVAVVDQYFEQWDGEGVGPVSTRITTPYDLPTDTLAFIGDSVCEDTTENSRPVGVPFGGLWICDPSYVVYARLPLVFTSVEESYLL